MKKIVFYISFMLLVFATASAQNKADLEKQRSAIQHEIDEVRRSLNETKKNKKETLGQLSLIQKKLQLRLAEIQNINKRIDLIQGDIVQSSRDIQKLKKELDTLKLQYQKSVVYAYKNRSNYDFLNFIFSANSFNDALKRVAYLRSYRQYREQQAKNIEDTHDKLQEKINSLNENKAKKSEVLVQQNKQKQVLEVEKKEKDAVVSKLKSRELELTREITAKKKQDQKLGIAINAAIRRAREVAAREAAAALKKKQAAAAAAAAATAARERELAIANANKNKTVTATTPRKEEVTPVAKPVEKVVEKEEPKVLAPKNVFDADPASKALSDDFEKNRGSLPWPIESGRISMHFGNQAVEGLKITYNNPGITIETDAGKAVKAVFDGEVSAVISVGPVQGVIIRHGKYFTTYSNLSSASVSRGQQVKRGQAIGNVAEKEDGQGELEFLISNERDQNFNPESWLRR